METLLVNGTRRRNGREQVPSDGNHEAAAWDR
jgi:hypothetical protein